MAGKLAIICTSLLLTFLLEHAGAQGLPSPFLDFLTGQRGTGKAVVSDRAGAPCLSPEDCQANECCLANNRPIGRKRRSAEGTCRQLGRKDSSCILPLNGVMPDPRTDLILLDVCPCSADLTCVVQPDAPVIVPQGKSGVCTSASTEPSDDKEEKDFPVEFVQELSQRAAELKVEKAELQKKNAENEELTEISM